MLSEPKPMEKDLHFVVEQQLESMEKLSRENRRLHAALQVLGGPLDSTFESTKPPGRERSAPARPLRPSSARPSRPRSARRADSASSRAGLRTAPGKHAREPRSELGILAHSEALPAQLPKQNPVCISSLERLVERATRMFEQALCENHRRRIRIDVLRRERLIFDSICKEFEDGLQQYKHDFETPAYQATSNQSSPEGLDRGESLHRTQMHNAANEASPALQGGMRPELVRHVAWQEQRIASMSEESAALCSVRERLEQEVTQLRALAERGTQLEDDELHEALLEQLADMRRRAGHFEAKRREAQRTLARIHRGVQAIFAQLRCSVADLPSSARGPCHPDEAVVAILSVVEQRTHDLLVRCPREGQSCQRPVSANPVSLPSAGDADDGGDEDVWQPVSPDELRAKTQRHFMIKR